MFTPRHFLYLGFAISSVLLANCSNDEPDGSPGSPPDTSGGGDDSNAGPAGASSSLGGTPHSVGGEGGGPGIGGAEVAGFDAGGQGGAGGAGGASESPCVLRGNLEEDEVPMHGSVAFILQDGEYQFLKRPGMEDTSLSFIDTQCKHAYGWSRDKPIDDDTSRESAWVLDLATLEFSDLQLPGTTWAVLRNGRDDGTVVGKLAIDAGTPSDTDDDEARGFVLDTRSGELQLLEREGFSDIGITAIDSSGNLVGFNDFGMVGFYWSNGTFTDLKHLDAYRLFPFQISPDGSTIVGFWGQTADNWYDNAVSPSFIARRRAVGFEVSRYELAGYSGVGLSALNAAGELAGIAYASPTSLPTVFHAASANAAPAFYPLHGELEPFVTGISAASAIYGQVFILEEPRPCNGHGTEQAGACTCDPGFLQDPYDPLGCLPPDAECAGHGHLHGDECHCDPGFKKSAANSGTCVPA